MRDYRVKSNTIECWEPDTTGLSDIKMLIINCINIQSKTKDEDGTWFEFACTIDGTAIITSN